MEPLEIKDNIVVFKPEILTILQFKTIWDRDKTKTKDKAFKDLMYVYQMASKKSVYSDYPSGEKEKAIKEDIILDKDYKASKEVLEAIKKFEEFTTPKQRLLDAAKYKIDEIATYLKNTPLTEDSSDSILAIFKSISTTIKNFDDIENAVKKEEDQNNTKRRGDKSTSLFEE